MNNHSTFDPYAVGDGRAEDFSYMTMPAIDMYEPAEPPMEMETAPEMTTDFEPVIEPASVRPAVHAYWLACFQPLHVHGHLVYDVMELGTTENLKPPPPLPVSSFRAPATGSPARKGTFRVQTILTAVLTPTILWPVQLPRLNI